uniref:Cation-transporting ATPase 13A3 n=1 Tax=Timema shepardi TaxID=629360 RepID=A0A7R9B169_TIMSH|nr:unnamed protein product [Timema shepardi]
MFKYSQVPMEIGIVHQYQFSSTLQRMSVITRVLGTQEFIVFCKGSPEMIMSLSLPHTVPPDVLSILENYTEKGYRVIALGMRTLDDLSFSNVEDIKREDVEKQLKFLGLVVLENRLKPETKGVISILRKADINVVMITGDNILTALSVARECGIIQSGEQIIDVSVVDDDSEKVPEVYFTHSGRFKPQEVSSEISNGQMKLLFDKDPESINIPSNYRFALTGKSWQLLKEHFPEVLQRVAVKGVVFARMSSDQKQQLVQEYQELGYYVAMCGDGANDCGALKAAHAGISLSEAESSVASPFTSREPNISCVPIVIREGRAALSTSFGIFKFMVAYSLTEFLSAIILYNIESNLSDLEFLFIDICLIVNFAFFYGKTEAYSGPLVKTPPLSSLLSLAPMLSLTLQLLVNILFQGICFHLVRLYPWYHAFNYESLTSYACYENYAVFCVSLFQYITLAVVFSEGAPYRKPIYTNKTLTISLMAMTLISIYITVYPAQWVIRWLELKVAEGYGFRIITVAIGFAGFFLGIFLERFFVKYALLSKFPKLSSGPKIKYEKLKEELVNYTDWPPITSKLPPMLPTPASEIPPELLTEIQFQISNELEGRCIGGVENESFEIDEINITKL